MNIKEFGSNFCEELSKHSETLKDKENIIFFDTGRSALRFLLDNLVHNIERVMLPQYICESVLKVFRERKYQITFYSVNEQMELCRNSFENMIDTEKPQLILIQTYFGFDTLCKDRVFLEKLRRRGIIIIEDVTHRILSDNLGTCSDFLIGSNPKWCAIPDGGFLVKLDKTNFFQPLRMKENTTFVAKRIAAQIEKHAYLENGSGDKKFIPLFEESEILLDEQKNYYSMSEYTRERILAVQWKQIAVKRYENYCILNCILKNVQGMEIIYSHIPCDVVPLYFPVYVKSNMRDPFRSYMRKKEIFLPIIWPMSPILQDKCSKSVQKIYNEILAIPCDQRYTEQEMMFVAYEIIQYFQQNIVKGVV